MHRALILVLLSTALCAPFGGAEAQSSAPSRPPWQSPSPWPDRIVVTIEDDPATSFSVTWRTDATVAAGRAEIVEATPRSRFDTGAESVAAESRTVDPARKRIDGETYSLGFNADLGAVRYHTARMTGLEPDTLYAYRVRGADGHWSAWMQTRTAPAESEPFRFLYFGDAQNGILSHWSRVVRAAFAQAPDARFAIHAGDLVNLGSRDFEWAEWFEAVGFIHGMIPALPLVGNHEYFDGVTDEDGAPVTGLSALWQPQFALPSTPDLPADLDETVYAVRYGDVLVVALNTMDTTHFADQARWLDALLERSSARWHVLAMHHPVFELVERRYAGFGTTGDERREALLPVIRRHGVDLVLQGHDHTYGRGDLGARSSDEEPRTPGARRGPASTVFVTSSSGAKMYEMRDGGWEPYADAGIELDRAAENTQFFQVIGVDGDSLTYEAYTATGQRYDGLRIEKPAEGSKRIVELETEIEATRMFENTGPYEEGRHDLVPRRPARR